MRLAVARPAPISDPTTFGRTPQPKYASNMPIKIQSSFRYVDQRKKNSAIYLFKKKKLLLFSQVDNNGKEVCSVLIDIVEKYRLTYNPNLCREGVSGQMDPHGLVVVTACGTLDNGPNCCGTFHQQFGLIRDPFESEYLNDPIFFFFLLLHLS